MNNSPTFEELKRNAIDSNKKMSWFSERYTKLFFSNFDSYYEDCCYSLRRNSIFLTRFVYDTSSVITDKYLILDYISLNSSKSFNKSGITASCMQDVSITISKMIVNPSSLSICMQEYFQQNFDEQKNLKKNYDHNDFYIFTHCVFPSVYGYFILPDVMKNAVSLIKSLFYNNNYEFASHLISAFFENTPNFLDTLFSLYQEKKFLEDKKKTSMKYFNFFIESLEVAISFLTHYHYEVIQSMVEVGNHIFIRSIVDKLLLPQIKLRNSKDILVQILSFISSHEDSAPYRILFKTFLNSKYPLLDEITISGGFNAIDVKYYRICLSGYEIKLLLNINELSQAGTLHKKQLDSCSKAALSRFTTIPIKIYPQFSQLKQNLNFSENKLLIFPPFKKAVFKRGVNEEYRRCFNNIQSFALTSEIDPIMFFVPELVNSSSASKVDKVVSKMHWEDDDRFLRFAYFELSNQYAESASQFDRIILYRFCEDYFKKVINHSNSLFECQIPSFKFDLNLELVNDFAFRKKILKFNYNEAGPFTDMTNSFQLAFNNISDTEREMYEMIKAKMKLMEKTKSVINHILQTLHPFIIRKMPSFFNQFSEMANDFYPNDEMKQDKFFFMVLFSLIDTWKVFFDSFCIFFMFFAKEVTNSSLLATQIKNSWERVRKCFQTVVYQEAPSIEEYVNNLLL